KYNSLVKDVTDNLDKFEIGVAVQKLYDFIWDIFCDWYIELCKVRLNGDDATAADTARAVLVYVMSGMLQLLHPFMPFITEEIWQSLPHDGESIMVSKWPEYSADLDFAADEAEFERIVKAIRAIRVRRSEMNVPPSRKAKVVIESAYADTFNAGAVFFKRLAYAGEVEINQPIDDPSAVTIITDDAKVYMPLGDLIDFEAERTRLNKERDAVLKDITFVENKLNNPGFVSKAPEKVVAEQRKNLEVYKEKLAMLDERLKALQ
ncbi:MAG: class I tRNA ligase family protein, partial [Clostridia bacterium]|nr:class I tRNA ligase family protein [Clostridia bacterium]